MPLGAKHGATAAPDRRGDGAPSAGSQPAALEKVSRAPYAAHLPLLKRSAPMDEHGTHRCAPPRSRPLAPRALQSAPLFPRRREPVALPHLGPSAVAQGARCSHVARSARRRSRDASHRFRCPGACRVLRPPCRRSPIVRGERSRALTPPPDRASSVQGTYRGISVITESRMIWI